MDFAVWAEWAQDNEDITPNQSNIWPVPTFTIFTWLELHLLVGNHFYFNSRLSCGERPRKPLSIEWEEYCFKNRSCSFPAGSLPAKQRIFVYLFICLRVQIQPKFNLRRGNYTLRRVIVLESDPKTMQSSLLEIINSCVKQTELFDDVSITISRYH